MWPRPFSGGWTRASAPLMAIRRAALYPLSIARGASGYLVLSNDRWNAERTQDVAGALVYKDSAPGRVPIPGADAYVGELFTLPKAYLVDPLVLLSSEQMRPAEEFLCEILALRELYQQPPQLPKGLAGVIDYPRWSQIYYAGPPKGDPPQNKRRVVVSIDQYNKVMRGGVCVRTTTKGYPGPGFPELADKTIAVCMAPDLFSEVLIRSKPRDRRPTPRELYAEDMKRVAEGLVDALDLHSLVS